MDLGSILLISGLAIFVFILVMRPFFEISPERRLISKAQTVMEDGKQRSILLAERDRVLRALQELEFDYSLGKIPAEDYPDQRNYLLRKGADIIKNLDSLNGQNPAGDAEGRVEAAVEANRADAKASAHPGNGNDDISALISARRRMKEEKPTGFCPQCGKPVTASDQFCARCGKTLH